LQNDRYIVTSCLISRNKVFKDGELVFESAGSAESFLDAIYNQYQVAYTKFYKMDSLCKLGFLAAEILLKGRHHADRYNEADTGLILSNANASLDVDLKYVKTISAGASPALFVYTLPNIMIGEISIRHRFKGENAFFVFRQFDGKFIAEYVNGLFESELIESCICGWVDFLGEEYRAILFLVEKKKSESGTLFTESNMNQLNQQDHE
jgi:hypothetical protein